MDNCHSGMCLHALCSHIYSRPYNYAMTLCVGSVYGFHSVSDWSWSRAVRHHWSHVGYWEMSQQTSVWDGIWSVRKNCSIVTVVYSYSYVYYTVIRFSFGTSYPFKLITNFLYRNTTGAIWFCIWGSGVEEKWAKLCQCRLSFSTDVDRSDDQVSEIFIPCVFAYIC